MARACELAGDRLIALPDGEIGERSDQYPAGDRSQWTAGLAGRLADEASLFDVVDEGTTNEQGFPVDFDSATRLRPRVGPAELGGRLRLGYDAFPRRTWPHVERLRASLGRPDLRMQVGLPTGFGVAAGFLSPPRALRYAPAFAACVAREATAVVQSIGAGNLLFQIEAPAEVVAAHRLPRPAVRGPGRFGGGSREAATRRGPRRPPPLLRRPQQHRHRRPDPLRPPSGLHQRPCPPLAADANPRLRAPPLRRRILTGPHRPQVLPSAQPPGPTTRNPPGSRLGPRAAVT